MSGDVIRPATVNDWRAIERLLTEAQLPLAGAREHIGEFVVADHEGSIAGCAALERYGKSALLRSVAVDPSRRRTGFGERMVRQLIFDARAQGVESLLLLTTTAPDWFPRFGFRRTTRDDVPVDLMQSAEFRGACPASAVMMSLDLRKR